MENNAFEHCTIVTAAHPNVLNYEDRLDYVKLKRDVKNWMCSNQQSQVILYCIFNTCNTFTYIKVELQFSTLLS